MPEIDAIIHQPARLRIMAALMSVAHDERVDFSYLKTLLGITDGNLGAHLAKLEEAGYIAMEKVFVARKPRTFLAATEKGKGAFREHVAALQAIVDASKPPKNNDE
jgi:DNA-binding MarR family transcriptional regulator